MLCWAVMQPMLRRSVPLLMVLLLGVADIGVAEPRLVPTPRASLIPASPTNRPFLAADHALAPVDLAAKGYVESEFAVSGFANVYDWTDKGDSDAVKARAANVPFTTRILVRRPKDAAKFSGRVIVELLNPTGLYDFAPLWGFSWEHFLRRGDAWVGVTVKPVAAATLRRFDAVRYAGLSFAYRRSTACAAPAAADLPDAENGLAWDVIAQVGALLKSSSKENPLLLLNPRRVIAAGYSQTGGYISTYASALHEMLRLGDGGPVFDGYLNAAGAHAAPINQCATPLAEEDVRRLPPPLGVPFVTVMTESDFKQGLQRRHEDVDAPGALRLYELAGAAHSGPFAAGQPATADLTIAGYAAPADDMCREPRGDFPLGYAFNAIWQQYDDLLLKQVPLTREPRIEVDAAGEVLRDEIGNARGGFRLPQVDVALASYRGRSSARQDDSRAQGMCALTGAMQKLDAANLKTRYRTRLEYLRRFGAAVDDAARARRLTPEDAMAIKAAAARATPAF
jgi:Alpha/beta hydrolase domain